MIDVRNEIQYIIVARLLDGMAREGFLTADELAQIHGRMAEAGISNAGAYMRKMALNGYILHVDLSPVRELVSLQRRCSNNLNQIAVHAHTYGLYPEEIDGLKEDYEKLWGQLSGVLKELAALVAWCPLIPWGWSYKKL